MPQLLQRRVVGFEASKVHASAVRGSIQDGTAKCLDSRRNKSSRPHVIRKSGKHTHPGTTDLNRAGVWRRWHIVVSGSEAVEDNCCVLASCWRSDEAGRRAPPSGLGMPLRKASTLGLRYRSGARLHCLSRCSLRRRPVYIFEPSLLWRRLVRNEDGVDLISFA